MSVDTAQLAFGALAVASAFDLDEVDVAIVKIDAAAQKRDQMATERVAAVVFDEFHERSSLNDLALGVSLERQLLGEDIKLVIMSATLRVTKNILMSRGAALHRGIRVLIHRVMRPVEPWAP